MKQTFNRAVEVLNVDLTTRKPEEIIKAQYIYHYLFKEFRPLYATDHKCAVAIGVTTGRDRATVLHGLGKFSDFIKIDKAYIKGYVSFSEEMQAITPVDRLTYLSNVLSANLRDIEYHVEKARLIIEKNKALIKKIKLTEGKIEANISSLLDVLNKT